MGCAQSHIEGEEPVSRCKVRRHLMRDAVASRHAFAAAHSVYAISLKNTGAALSDFGHGESIIVHPPFSSSASTSSSSVAVAVPLPPPIEAPPPPPPPPAEVGTPTSSIQRATSMPNISSLKSSQSHHDSLPIPEDDPVPDYPVSQSEIMEEKPAETPDNIVEEPLRSSKQGRKEKRVKMAGVVSTSTQKNVSLLHILNELDDHFLKASESAHEVSKMLEVTRMHYHSNFAESQGRIDHSAKLLRVITWNRSHTSEDDGADKDEFETHATVLDKMLAWEKKLYDEVKASELMKIEYQNKIALLNKQKKRNSNPETIERTKAAVSHLHTRYIVDMQSMDSTIAEINRLRDHRLYTKLVALVDGMSKMWETMHSHHVSQCKISGELRALDTSNAPRETSEHQYDRTVQLWQVVGEWHSQLQKLITHQKEYIYNLNEWLKLNLIPIESNLKEKVSSPSQIQRPPIQALLLTWHEQLEKLPDSLAKGAIFNFSAVINAIIISQQEELKLKEKCEESKREYTRKLRAFEEWSRKYSQKMTTLSSSEVSDPPSNDEIIQTDPSQERKLAVETAKSKLDSDVEAYQKLCKKVREKSLATLKNHLPELFRSLSEFALACSEMYKKLNIRRPEEPDAPNA
ncbi:nitrate regulatory gene2 protein-like [Dioscorea cayenensis subsp. rotundata]|uniref:Nitrate regulatory gene2 protein-like n=1 Tax=Dioscorea cayennensis subsp. rotundata TaxID=55577 RepID=A0AB40AJK2_DIOCR|nr:nitrate regulatory gene2 protein-like [Dioscorea cayenensis subsp. rotundata]